MDAARVAFRQKGIKSVTVFYRRTRDEMPAYAEEIEAALAEGIKIEELVAPVAVQSKDGKLTGLKFIRNKLSERDASGRQKPVPVPGTEFDVELDTLVVAISEEPETAGLEGIGRTKWNTPAINTESHMTDRAGVFAGGDVVTGPNTVIEAIAAGKNAAVMIDRFIKGQLLRVLPKTTLPVAFVPPLALGDDEEAKPVDRAEAPHLAVAKRSKSFAEVELCLSEQAAKTEACRCMRCDLEFTQPE
jgi:NADH-quinone oxidoreductase subunit F